MQSKWVCLGENIPISENERKEKKKTYLRMDFSTDTQHNRLFRKLIFFFSIQHDFSISNKQERNVNSIYIHQ